MKQRLFDCSSGVNPHVACCLEWCPHHTRSCPQRCLLWGYSARSQACGRVHVPPPSGCCLWVCWVFGPLHKHPLTVWGARSAGVRARVSCMHVSRCTNTACAVLPCTVHAARDHHQLLRMPAISADHWRVRREGTGSDVKGSRYLSLFRSASVLCDSAHPCVTPCVHDCRCRCCTAREPVDLL